MVIHVVRRGDTLLSIARQYGVSVQRIISDNGLEAARTLVEGQALVILLPQTVHTVQPGESLAGIAAQYGVTEMQLLQNNPVLVESAYLYAGEQIVIRFQEAKGRQITVNGYAYPYINRSVLYRALPYLTYLTIFGYGFTEEGQLIPTPDDELIRLAREFQAGPVMLLSSITEDGNFSSERASRLFNSPELQTIVMDQIIQVMDAKGYVGLDIDFEFIDPADGEAFLNFLRYVSGRLHERGYFMNTDLAPKTSAAQTGLLYEAHNYREIGDISDTVLLMTYEWGYTYGPPMAVAPIDQVRQVVTYGVSEIPPAKILLGVPNYGYDWPLPFERGLTRATTIGNQQAVDIAQQFGSRINYDETAMAPYFEYLAPDGIKHVVWFEDARSIRAKLSLLDEFGLLGAGYWNVMRPFAQNWALLSAMHEIRKIT